MTLPEPVKVSPLIKLFRYGLLLAGIIYGASKYKVLRNIEDGKKEERERKKAERDRQIAEERKVASERDIANLVAVFSEGSALKPKADDKRSELEEPCSFKENKVDTEDNCTFKEVENIPTTILETDTIVLKDEFDVYADQFNLSDETPISSSTPKKSADSPKHIQENNSEKNSPTTSFNENEYFIETFQDKVPYAAAPDNEISDFLPHDMK